MINTDYIFFDIPVMSFVEDLASRWGDADDYSFTNKKGMADEFESQFLRDSSKYKNITLDDFLENMSIKDVNLGIRRNGVKEIKALNQGDEEYDDNRIGCCIEQTSANALRTFLKELMTGIKKTTNAAKTAAMGTYKSSKLFVDEEGDLVSEAELETTTEYVNVNSDVDYEILSNILYLTKQLIYFSYYTGWFLPSFVKVKLRLIEKHHWHMEPISYPFKDRFIPAARGYLATFNPMTGSEFVLDEISTDLNRKVDFTNLKFALIDDDYASFKKVKQGESSVDMSVLRNIFNTLIDQLVKANLMYSFLETDYSVFTMAIMDSYKQRVLLKSNILCLGNGIRKDVVEIFDRALNTTEEDLELITGARKRAVIQSLKQNAYYRVNYVRNRIGKDKAYSLKGKQLDDILGSFINKYKDKTEAFIHSDFNGCGWNLGIFCGPDGSPYLFDLTIALSMQGGDTLGKRYGVLTDFGYCVLLYSSLNRVGYFKCSDYYTNPSFDHFNITMEYI